jgi:glyoxylate reductase
VPFLEHRSHAIVTRKPPDPIETQMMELFACRLNRDDKPLGKSELTAAVGHPDVLPATVDDRIDCEVLAAAGPGRRSRAGSRWARR